MVYSWSLLRSLDFSWWNFFVVSRTHPSLTVTLVSAIFLSSFICLCVCKETATKRNCHSGRSYRQRRCLSVKYQYSPWKMPCLQQREKRMLMPVFALQSVFSTTYVFFEVSPLSNPLIKNCAISVNSFFFQNSKSQDSSKKEQRHSIPIDPKDPFSLIDNNSPIKTIHYTTIQQ